MEKSKEQKVFNYTAIFEPAEEGGYVVFVPALPGVVTEGDTLKEATQMAREAIVLHIEGLRADGEAIPAEGNFIQRKLQVKA